MRVAIHELKAGLSRLVAQAHAGEIIEITSHDKPVARLIGMPATAATGLARMLAEGAVTWRGAKPAFAPPVKLPPFAATFSDMLIEDRA